MLLQSEHEKCGSRVKNFVEIILHTAENLQNIQI